MLDFDSLAGSLKSSECEVLTDSPMSRQITFKVGGNAKVIAFPKTEKALADTLLKVKEAKADCIVIGNGSNLLVRDSGIDGVVVKTTQMCADVEIDGNILRCSAGTSLSKLCTAAYENSLTGLEFAYGIPGTVGGAVFMNAGAYGGEMKDVLSRVTHITPDCKTETVTADSLDLGYRSTFYTKHTDYIITSAEFVLQRGNKAEIKAKMDELIAKRKDKQPLEYPSAGSTFKRPEGHFAGALIEQCGLKGFSVGNAEVSEKHAGFIINKGGCTAQDILDLIESVTKTVKEQTGVTLEPEVRIIP